MALAAAGAALVLGVALPCLAILQGWDLPMVVVGGVVPGGAFVVVGIWAIRGPRDLKRIIGAAVGACSAPLYYFALHPLQHPLDAGADIGRAFVALLALVVLPLNMRMGAMAADRLGQPISLGGDETPGYPRRAALAVGLGALLVALLILWRAHGDAPSAEIAHWEFIHHGVVPAIPILMVGVCTMAFPRRFTWMLGALVGTIPALACSSLVVDPEPSDHGQTPMTLVAYTLPLTLPITVGYGILAAESVRRRVRQVAARRLPARR